MSSQSESDTIYVKNKYGIRAGIDLSKQIRMLTEEYSGLSLYGDIKIKERLFIVAELGNDQKTIETENINSKLSGSYIKTGFNYNLYNNLPGLNNEIYVGLRYSQSLFKNELIDYSIYNKDRFWNDQRILEYKEFDNLKSSWIEFVVGFNSEIKNNLFMGLSLRLNRMLKQDIPENFTNLFIPGFNKVTENNNFGTGITYSIIYQIPIIKK
ncbi:MAG: DUF6048 family protein [Flavobacteriaceae bacterium]|jgi:hypothetical protein|nr:hypothetical protein [Flavobacteriaceae bacterium]MBL6590928.1 hypothetical protein [Flavobacteriaceae bacterium]MBL6681391.1 hypothetical protein [Flavobacteriaceae bacterium]